MHKSLTGQDRAKFRKSTYRSALALCLLLVIPVIFGLASAYLNYDGQCVEVLGGESSPCSFFRYAYLEFGWPFVLTLYVFPIPCIFWGLDLGIYLKRRYRPRHAAWLLPIVCPLIVVVLGWFLWGLYPQIILWIVALLDMQ